MTTLFADLDGQVRKAPRYSARTVSGYFRRADLGWWKKLSGEEPYQEQESAIRKWLKEHSYSRMLELGAGFGRITALASSPTLCALHLVEVNVKAQRVLRRQFPEAEVIADDFTSYSWELQLYDLIIAAEVLVHVPDIPALLERIEFALIPAGSVIVSVTPLSWYQEYVSRRPIIDRGIDQSEFEKQVLKLFSIRERHCSTNGQLLTYLCGHKSNA